MREGLGLLTALALAGVAGKAEGGAPCQKTKVGAGCVGDEDCYGEGSECVAGRCECGWGLERSKGAPVCVPAPWGLGKRCSESCQAPWLCRDGRCECWQGSVVQGRCSVPCPPGLALRGHGCAKAARLGQPCDSDPDCLQPLSHCRQGTCRCHPGTTELHGSCAPMCPDGSEASQPCKRSFMGDLDIWEHLVQTDTCPEGWGCVGWRGSESGRCCPLSCPYGSPALGLSCEAGSATPCPSHSHFCQRLSLGLGQQALVCCPRACREPRPALVGGRCVEAGQRGDRCSSDAECEGGRTMRCVSGRCECGPGHLALQTDLLPSCALACGGDEVGLGVGCAEAAVLGLPCLSSRQCGRGQRCDRGRCRCHCGLAPAGLLAASCLPPTSPFAALFPTPRPPQLPNVTNHTTNA